MDFTQTHFELFGLPQAYALDRDRLRLALDGRPPSGIAAAPIEQDID